MGFEFSISFGKKETRSSIEDPKTPFSAITNADIFGGERSISGATVSKDTALTLTAVYRAVNILSGVMATLPWNIYRRGADGSVNIDTSHPLYYLLHDEPYHLYSSFTFREAMMVRLLLTDGNFYALKKYDAYGKVIGLKILDNVEPVITADDQKWYFVQGYPEPFPARDILHVAGFGWDGVKGKSPIRIAREALGMGLTLQEFGQQFFANGTHAGGVVEHPSVMKQEQYDRFKESFSDKYKGVQKSGNTIILEGGAKFNRLGIAPEEAQFLQSRKFSIDEVARIFGLPPHMLAQMDSATFSNIEHQGIELVQYTILTWCRRIESEVNRNLIATNERGTVYNRFNVNGLLRGDSASRATYLSTMVNGGIYTRDEARAYEEMNKRGGLADELLFPLNLATEEQFKLPKQITNAK